MNLITSQEDLAKYIPNVLASVKGESSLLDKLAPALSMSEQWVINDFLGQNLFDSVCKSEEDSMLRIYASRIVISDAFRRTIPSLDLILTPNGFGIVNNSNVAPASRERVDRLMENLENGCDQAIGLLLHFLPSLAEWQDTEQHERFASTMFPKMEIVDMMGITQHRYRKFLEFQPLIVNIEEMIINQFIGQEQLDVFRKEAMSPSSTSYLMKSVIRSLRAYEAQVLKNKLSTPEPSVCTPPTALVSIVNIIRNQPEEFPLWHSSSIAELYKPAIFENKKKDTAYWF